MNEKEIAETIIGGLMLIIVIPAIIGGWIALATAFTEDDKEPTP